MQSGGVRKTKAKVLHRSETCPVQGAGRAGTRTPYKAWQAGWSICPREALPASSFSPELGWNSPGGPGSCCQTSACITQRWHHLEPFVSSTQESSRGGRAGLEIKRPQQSFVIRQNPMDLDSIISLDIFFSFLAVSDPISNDRNPSKASFLPYYFWQLNTTWCSLWD